MSPQQKPSPKAAAHGPLTQRNFLLPTGNSLPPHPIHHSQLSGHCQKPPAEGQYQPRVPIHPQRKGPVCVRDQWLVTSWRPRAGLSPPAVGGKPFVLLWSDGAEVWALGFPTCLSLRFSVAMRESRLPTPHRVAIAHGIPCSWRWISSHARCKSPPACPEPPALFTDVSLHLPPTLLAHHIAAPVVLAVTSLHHLLRVGVVATAAAHQVAAVAAHGGLVALPVKRRMHNGVLRDVSLCQK